MMLPDFRLYFYLPSSSTGPAEGCYWRAPLSVFYNCGTHPRRDTLILCAFVKVSSPSSSVFDSAAAAGRRCVSQGHDAGSVLLTGPASGRWTHMTGFILARLPLPQLCHNDVMWNEQPSQTKAVFHVKGLQVSEQLQQVIRNLTVCCLIFYVPHTSLMFHTSINSQFNKQTHCGSWLAFSRLRMDNKTKK